MVDTSELRQELDTLIGKTPTNLRFPINSMIIYFSGMPGDVTVQSIWIEPPWRFEVSKQFIIGSLDLTGDDIDHLPGDERDRQLRARFETLNVLERSEFKSYCLDNVSLDLTLEFGNGVVVRKFANSLYSPEQWTYRNVSKKLAMQVCPLRIRSYVYDEQKRRKKT